MAKGSNGDSRTPKTPARRRSTKAAQTAQAPDTLGVMKAAFGASTKDAHRRPALAEVQRRAYELYLKRGGVDGHDVEDWLEAERQLSSQAARG